MISAWLIINCDINYQQNLQSMLLRVLEETERIHQLFMSHYLELNSLSCSCCWISCSISLNASFTCGHDVKNGVRVWNWTNLAYIGIESACTILSMLLLHVATTKRKRQQQETLHANGALDHSMEDWEAFWPAILTPLQKNCKGRYIDEHI
jgi:hypothetical protein